MLTFCRHIRKLDLLSYSFAKSQILALCQEKNEIAARVHTIIDNFAERGLRSLAVASQVICHTFSES